MNLKLSEDKPRWSDKGESSVHSQLSWFPLRGLRGRQAGSRARARKEEGGGGVAVWDKADTIWEALDAAPSTTVIA